jgi:hypothetical protein
MALLPFEHCVNHPADFPTLGCVSESTLNSFDAHAVSVLIHVIAARLCFAFQKTPAPVDHCVSQ